MATDKEPEITIFRGDADCLYAVFSELGIVQMTERVALEHVDAFCDYFSREALQILNCKIIERLNSHIKPIEGHC